MAKPWFWLVISTRPVCVIVDGLVGAVVAELELVRSRAERQTEQLMPQADPEDWHLPDEFAECLCRVLDRLGITRAVADEYPVGFPSQNLACIVVGRDHSNPAARLDEVPQDALFHAAIDRHHVQRGPDPTRLHGERALEAAFPDRFGLRGHPADHVLADNPGPAPRDGHKLSVVQGFRRDGATHRPLNTELTRDRPGIDTLEGGDAALLEILFQLERRAEITPSAGEFLDDKSLDFRPA